jgi:hypothetical protein
VKRGPSTIVAGIAFAGSVITLLLSTPMTLAQALPRKSFSEAHLEHLQDPPATIVPRRFEISPRMVAPFGPYTSYQVNVDANGHNIVGDAANEPSLCVDPTNPNRMAVGWRQFDSVTSNFRQAGHGFSSDGGVTWTFPGVLQNNVFRSDPVLNADSTGRFYYLSLLQNFFDDMWRSTDGGADFSDLGPATGGDKQWFTIDNTNSPGHGFQYQCWSTAGDNYNGRQFSRSTDGGLSWRDPVAIPGSPIWGTLDVDSNGNVFTSGVNPDTGQIWCLRSTNAKNAALKPSFDLMTAVNLGGDVIFSQHINPEGLAGQINLAVDRSGTVSNNNVYLLASLQRVGYSSGSDVMFVRSSNGGQSFSAPIRVNDDTFNPNKWHWLAAMAVAPSGRIDAVWLDTRNAANNSDSQLFYSFSNDEGRTWSENVAVSNSFNPFLGYPNQNKMGDYITVVSDNSGANVAYTATFNGEEDVYFVHVSASTCGVAADFRRNDAAGWITEDNSSAPGAGWFNGDGTIFAAAPAAKTSVTPNTLSAAPTVSNWLLTPPVTLQNGANLTFYTRSQDRPLHADRVQVRLSTNGDSTNVGNTPDSVGDFTTVLLDINPANVTGAYPADWTRFSATVSGLTAPTTGRVAFRYFVENSSSGSTAQNAESIGIEAIEFACTPAYTIAASVTPAGGGSITGAGRYSSGSNVSLMATPNPNFAFANWTENGAVVSTSANFSFTASANRTLLANFTAVPRFTAAPTITPNGGSFKRKAMFKITDATPGAIIYYTTDGTDPTTSSAVFPTPQRPNQKIRRVAITGVGTHTVKAMAVAPAFNNSPITAATFVIR